MDVGLRQERPGLEMREFILPVFLLVLVLTHLYQWNQVWVDKDSLARDILAAWERPLKILRLFGPFLAVLIANWTLRTGAHSALNTTLWLITLVFCVISVIDLARTIAIMVF